VIIDQPRSTYTDAEALAASYGSVETGITAGVVQTQAGATALTGHYCSVDTVATADDGVALPAAAAGRWCVVKNNTANICLVWPASGDDLGNGVDAATHLQPGQQAEWRAIDGTTWREKVAPDGLLQHVEATGTGAGTETSTSGATPEETTLRYANYRPRYSSSYLEVGVMAPLAFRGNGTSVKDRRGRAHIYQDCTDGAGNPITTGTQIQGSMWYGLSLVAASTNQALTHGPAMLRSIRFAAIDRTARLFLMGQSGIANVNPEYINGAASSSLLYIKEYRI